MSYLLKFSKYSHIWYSKITFCFLFFCRQLCLQKDATSISICPNNELSFVLSQAFRYSTSVKLIGLNDFLLNGKYKWLDRTVGKHLTWACREQNNDRHYCFYLGSFGNMYYADEQSMDTFMRTFVSIVLLLFFINI